MKIEFCKQTPPTKFYRLGVQGNNLTDYLDFIISRNIGENIDLNGYKPFIKFQTADYSFVAKDDNLEKTPSDDNADKLELRYYVPREITELGSVDCQIQFEEYSEESVAVWQTDVFNVSFDKQIDADAEIEKQNPTILQKHEQRLSLLEETLAAVVACANRLEFPNVGKRGVVYIDEAENTAYRYDTANNNYYIVGSDYNDIEVIKSR